MGYGMDEEEYFDDEEYEREQEDERLNQVDRIHTNMKTRYRDAKNAETGATISCPYCSKLIVKKTYNKIFCSNARTSGENNCKDKYWNFTDSVRGERAKKWMENE